MTARRPYEPPIVVRLGTEEQLGAKPIGAPYAPPAVRFADCPRCGAKAGERCRSLGLRQHVGGATTKPLGTPVLAVHAARHRALVLGGDP